MCFHHNCVRTPSVREHSEVLCQRDAVPARTPESCGSGVDRLAVGKFLIIDAEGSPVAPAVSCSDTFTCCV